MEYNLLKNHIRGKIKNLSLYKCRFLNPKTEAANCSYTVFCKPEIVLYKEDRDKMYEIGLIILGMWAFVNRLSPSFIRESLTHALQFELYVWSSETHHYTQEDFTEYEVDLTLIIG